MRRRQTQHALSAHAYISEKAGVRYLHLNSDTIQSAMQINRPSWLVLPYTRAMMGFLLLQDTPQQVWMIGLGAGSIPKFIAQHLPQTDCTSIELHPQIVALARSSFALPADDGKHFQVLLGDGSQFVQNKHHCVDTILVDGFDGFVVAPELATESFFANCYAALRDDGILAMNLWSHDKLYPVFLERIKQVFAGQVLCLPTQDKGNVVVFAYKNHRLSWGDKVVRERALYWQKHTGIEMTDFMGLLHPVKD